jgi:hypothetical protein
LKSILPAFVTLAILTGVAPASSQAAQRSQPAASIGGTRAVADALRGGGYVVLVRHGATFSDQADTDPANLGDVAKQRNQ